MIRAGVLGDPVEHSLSPRIFAAWFEEAGIDGVYEKRRVTPQDFVGLVHDLAAAGWKGVNVTIPHKAAALALADETSDAARQIGAANLLTFENDRIRAGNTDHIGFEKSMTAAGLKTDGVKAVVLGAGGAAAAIIYALRNFEHVVICNRTLEKAQELAGRFGNAVASSWEDREEELAGADILVNTTSLGMAGQPSLEIKLGALPSHAGVADIVYTPLATPLLQQAKSKGLRTAHGLSMLVWQAVPSFEAFTGRAPVTPRDILRELEEERQ